MPVAKLLWPGRIQLTAAAVAAAAIVAYWPAFQCGFVNFDDPIYVSKNSHVQDGLSASGLRWALASFEGSNWHPLTWLSLQWDATLWKNTDGKGLDPFGFHLTNVLLHAANAVLLFLALQAATGAYGRSLMVALLFAVHPLRVESVAWISERKDVLSAFFGFLSLYAYALYARVPSMGRNLVMTMALALSLLSKPMFVTLPCLFLVLDWWPFGRAKSLRDWLPLVVEKLPLFVLSGAAASVTYYIQDQQGTIRHLTAYSLPVRLENATVSYVTYLAKTAWPLHLAVFYPHPGEYVSAAAAIASAVVLVALTAAALALRRRAPYLLVGWLWYLGCLVPVIGLVQVSTQAYADRYAYFPQVGILVALCWGVTDLAGNRQRLSVALGSVAAVALTVLTWNQLQSWKDSAALWSHALQVTGPNDRALSSLGAAYEAQGKSDEAARCYRDALECDPNSNHAHFNLGAMAARQGRLEEAAREFGEACRVEPGIAGTQWAYAGVLQRLGRLDESAEHYERAIQLSPERSGYYCDLGQLEMKRGNAARAVALFRKGVEVDANDADAREGLGLALIRDGQAADGVARMREAIGLDPRSAQRRIDLARVLENLGDKQGAAEQYLEAARRLEATGRSEQARPILERLRAMQSSGGGPGSPSGSPQK
jgi:tetratricopeptide (TPR) repeat protein